MAPTIGPFIVGGPVDVARADGGLRFGSTISLIEHRLDGNLYRPGDDVRGYLLFGGLEPMSRDYTVFVHLDGPLGLVANDDSQPGRGVYPTSFWRRGDLVRHEFQLRIPPDAPPGAYVVRAGWYDLATGQRLATPNGDAVDLETLQVN
jgi:hypothetical protein